MKYTRRERLIQDLFETHGIIVSNHKTNRRLLMERMVEWIECMKQALHLPRKNVGVSLEDMIIEALRLSEEEVDALHLIEAFSFPAPNEYYLRLIDIRREKELAARRIGLMQRGETEF